MTSVKMFGSLHYVSQMHDIYQHTLCTPQNVVLMAVTFFRRHVGVSWLHIFR